MGIARRPIAIAALAALVAGSVVNASPVAEAPKPKPAPARSLKKPGIVRGHPLPVTRNTRTSVAAMKRAARKRRNVRARSRK